MSDQPCPCCGHDQVAVEMVIKDELEENQALKAKVAALEVRCAGLERERDAFRQNWKEEIQESFQFEQERDALQVKLEAAEYALRYAKFAIETTNTMNGFTQSTALELINDVFAGKASEAVKPDKHHAVINRAILDVIAATGAYLPPDGIDAQKCINRVLQATDNAEVVAALAILAGHAPATPMLETLAQSGELWVGPEEEE